jgi:hypothetical protein
MEAPQNTPKALFRILKVMYIAILAWTILYIGIAYAFIKQSGQVYITDKMMLQYFWVASMVLTLAIIPLAYIAYKKKLEGIKPEKNLTEKLLFYRTPFLLRLALLEAGCIINTSLYLISGNQYILYAAIITLIVLLINYPTVSAVSNDLYLTNDEMDQL